MGDFSLDQIADLPLDLYVGGKQVPASDAGRFDVLDPATGGVIASVANGTVEDALACVEAADAAAAGWAATPPRQRSEILRKAFELMTERADEIAHLISLENGKALPDARGETAYAAEFFRWYAEEAVRGSGSVMTAPSAPTRSSCSSSRWGSACW
jgi:succinate-semialdehyde dehydrogenase / glutarate-semialdehyde dehydrogenase